MARQTSFAYQANLLEELSKVLSELQQDLKSLSQKYESSISSLYEDRGLMEEVYNDYEEMYSRPMKQSLQELADRITSHDIPFVEKEIDFFCSR